MLRPGGILRLARGVFRLRRSNCRNAAHASFPLLQVHPEVAEALGRGHPVVALESTIISHGMPYPQNLQCATEVEAVVRNNGATPATVAVIDGRVCVGLEPADLEALARAGHGARKCSRRDLAAVVARRGMGATTVAGTMVIAAAAGIPVFVTGGIGGVHRGGEVSLDVSADLTELGRTPVAVVCAGVKSILDIPRTLEVLETQGVPVFAYGTSEFPAFYTPRSGVAAPDRLNTPNEVAEVIYASHGMRLSSGLVLAVPNTDALAEGAVVDAAVQQALREAEAAGVHGWRVTPFLLQRVNELTGGASLRANIQLVKQNAAVGAQVATALAALYRQAGAGAKHSGFSGVPGLGSRQRRGLHTSAKAGQTPLQRTARPTMRSTTGGSSVPRSQRMSSSGIAEPASKSPSDRVAGPRPIIIGGAVQDLLMRPFPGEALRLHTSNPGTVTASWGGVGRNIAEAAALLGASSPVLVTCVGNDAAGDELESYCAAVGVDLRSVTAAEGAPHPRTAVYAATLDGSGDLVAAVADMAAFDAIDAASLYDGELRGSSDASSAEEQGRRRLCDLIRESAAAAEVRIEPESDLGIVVDEGTSSSPSRAIVVVDGNVPAPGVRAAARLAAAAGDIDWARGSDAWVSSSPGSEDSDGSAAVTPEDVSVESLVFVYECTSVAKCVRAVEADALHLATLVKPNRLEVIALGDAWRARMGLPPVASVATEARADAQNAAAPAAASHVAAASPSAPPDASTTEQPDVDTSADDIIAGGSGERKRPRTADAARHAAYRGKGRQTRDREAGDGAAPSPAVVTQSVYFDRASEPAAADASRGRLLGQHSYALPGDAASSSAGEGPAADPLVLSVYEEFGAEAAAATKAVGGAADIGGGEPASAAGSEGAGSADAAHAGTSLDYEVLAAAQAVLAAMVRPGGLRAPLGAPALSLSSLSPRAIFERLGDEAFQTSGTPEAVADPLFPGATLEDRKHVVVTLGDAGVLWLSAPPAPDNATADLLAVLPFFAAARHPALGFDFKLAPAPHAAAFVKCTGAGDTLVGALVAALARGDSVAKALRHGLAAAHIAVQSPAGESTIASCLSCEAVEAVALRDVAPVDAEYC